MLVTILRWAVGVVAALLADRSAWQIVTFEDEATAPAGLAELAPAW